MTTTSCHDTSCLEENVCCDNFLYIADIDSNRCKICGFQAFSRNKCELTHFICLQRPKLFLMYDVVFQHVNATGHVATKSIAEEPVSRTKKSKAGNSAPVPKSKKKGNRKGNY